MICRHAGLIVADGCVFRRIGFFSLLLYGLMLVNIGSKKALHWLAWKFRDLTVGRRARVPGDFRFGHQ